MRVLVCGGRDYDNESFAFAFLDALNAKKKISVIIEGGARGADCRGAEWAADRRVPKLTYHAQWNDLETEPVAIKTNSYGKTYNALAGFVRNQRMIDEGKPDLCVAFPGGNGTRDMIERCRKAGIKVIELNR